MSYQNLSNLGISSIFRILETIMKNMLESILRTLGLIVDLLLKLIILIIELGTLEMFETLNLRVSEPGV